MRNLLLSLLFVGYTFSQSNVLLLSTTSSGSLSITDLHTIEVLFVDGLKQNGIHTITTSEVSCSENECAKNELAKTDKSDVIYMNVQTLGSKIIVKASIINNSSSFSERVTVTNIEDMENASIRLAKAIALRETIDVVADLDNIMSSETEASERRERETGSACASTEVTEKNGRVTGLDTNAGHISAGTIVNATAGWSSKDAWQYTNSEYAGYGIHEAIELISQTAEKKPVVLLLTETMGMPGDALYIYLKLFALSWLHHNVPDQQLTDQADVKLSQVDLQQDKYQVLQLDEKVLLLHLGEQTLLQEMGQLSRLQERIPLELK